MTGFSIDENEKFPPTFPFFGKLSNTSIWPSLDVLLKVRVGNLSDVALNPMCWLVQSMKAGRKTHIDCAEQTSGR